MSEKLIPFIIFFLSLLVIYGILSNKKNKKIQNYIENFNNVNSGIIQNANNNTTFTKELANGDWTTLETKVDDNYHVINLMKININFTTIDYIFNKKILGTIDFMGSTYNINFFLDGNLHANLESSNVPMNLYINFINDLTQEDLLKKNMKSYIKNVPKCIVSIYVGDMLNQKYLSYKVYDNKVDQELQKIILTKDFYILKPPQLFNFDIYHKLINAYNFPLNYIFLDNYINYNDGNIRDKNAFNDINNKYHGKIQFAIQRIFNSPTNNEIKTKVSYPLLIDNITKNNLMPTKINITSFKKDKLANNILDFFVPKSTKLYFYKLIESDISYDYGNNSLNNISRNLAKLQNNSTDMFKPIIGFNDVKSVEKVFKNKYKIILVTNVNSDFNNDTIIPFSDLYDYL